MIATTKPEVYVDGMRLSNIAPGWGSLKVGHRWPLGCWETSWVVPVKRQRRNRQLQEGAKVRVYYGASPIWRGDLPEPNWDTGEMVAIGSVRQGEQTLALGNGTGAITSIPNLAIDQAFIRMVIDWRRGTTSLSNLAFSDPAQSTTPIYLNDLLNAWSKFNDVRWGVDARGDVFVGPDPIRPTWVVSPDSGVLGVAGGGEAKSVVGRYLADATTYANVRAGSGSPEIGVSLAKFGVLTETAAQMKTDAILDQLSVVRGWTNGLTLAASQIYSAGGIQANLAAVRAGQMMRLQGLRDERGRSAVTDIVLGETVWDVADQTVLCNPIDLVARDLGSIIEDAGAELLTGL